MVGLIDNNPWPGSIICASGGLSLSAQPQSLLAFVVTQQHQVRACGKGETAKWLAVANRQQAQRRGATYIWTQGREGCTGQATQQRLGRVKMDRQKDSQVGTDTIRPGVGWDRAIAVWNMQKRQHSLTYRFPLVLVGRPRNLAFPPGHQSGPK